MENKSILNDQIGQTQQASETAIETEPAKKKNRSRTLGVRILKAELMAAGITNHSESLTLHGLTAEYLTAFKQFILDTKTINETQEKLKAQQKEKTAELTDQLKELTLKMKYARDTVKNVIPQELWKEFGITATR